MRIRRRPPGQPLAYLLPSDPYPAPQSSPPPASRDHQERPPPPPGDKQGEGELHLHPATNDSAADLGDARSSSPLRRPALPPQDGAVEQRSSGLQGAQQQQGPADGGSSLENNGLHHRHVPEPVTIQAGEHLSNNGVGAAAVVTTTATTGAKATKQKQQVTKNTSGGVKRAPPSPSKLMAGSRCSRKNGRGWRCSQPTLMGYALCQYHLGKGRMKSGSAATGGRGPGQLGRTEHAKKTSAADVAPATAAATGGRGPGQLGRTEHAKKTSAAAAVAPATAAPKADVPPPPSVAHATAAPKADVPPPPSVAPATPAPKAGVPLPPSVQHC
ncbi:uncharacterized protein [Miscanthus floridulus]|uniref:uncharacterized protein n=1 Tax=Miscanthus floridulus TaxID=154761 RepID=UPI00345A98C2